jgi:hypothetical protein
VACGRSIPRFPLGVRAINMRGEHVRDRTAWAHEVMGDLPD